MLHNAGPHGHLHCFSIDGKHFADMREHLNSTSCFADTGNLNRFFGPELLSVLSQTNHEGELKMMKLPDGHVVYKQNGNGEKLLEAIMRDPEMCKHKSLSPNMRGGTVCVYAVAHKPDKNHKSFLITEKEGLLKTHEVPRDANVDHVIAKVAGVIPLDNTPRIIYDAPNLGVLRGVMLQGYPAQLLKSQFLKLVQKTQGENMYDVPIKISREVSATLMMDDPDEHIWVSKLANGIVGYQNNGAQKRFSFVCNSNDFFDSRPSTNEEDHILQLFKMTYAQKEGPGIIVNLSNQEGVYKQPTIHLGMMVQDVLNTVEHACRHAMLKHTGCHKFRKERLMYQDFMNGAGSDEEVSEEEEDSSDEDTMVQEFMKWAKTRKMGG